MLADEKLTLASVAVFTIVLFGWVALGAIPWHLGLMLWAIHGFGMKTAYTNGKGAGYERFAREARALRLGRADHG